MSSAYDSDHVDSPDEVERPSKRVKSRSSASKPSSDAVKSARKAARMQRNREAAQLSRDRKKAAQADLEARVVELQARLDATTPAFTPLPVVTDEAASRIAALEAENAQLKQQLALEAASGTALRDRLGHLESQVSTLLALASSSLPQSLSPTIAPAPAPEPAAHDTDLSSLFSPDFTPFAIDKGCGYRLVAREAIAQQRTPQPLTISRSVVEASRGRAMATCSTGRRRTRSSMVHKTLRATLTGRRTSIARRSKVPPVLLLRVKRA